METIKLPNGNVVNFCTVAEKNPQSGEYVLFYVPLSIGHFKFAVGRYKTFKTSQGRFVSEEDGSHLESTVICWAPQYEYLKK